MFYYKADLHLQASLSSFNRKTFALITALDECVFPVDPMFSPTPDKYTTYEDIALVDINDSHIYDLHPYLQSSPTLLDLYNSISSYGILSPPTLLESQSNKFDILSGRLRIKCLRQISSKNTLYCRVLPASTDQLEILNFILEEQFLSTGLSVVEQAMFIALCERTIHDERKRHSFISGLPKGRITRGTHFLASLSQLQDPMLRDFDSGKLSLKILSALSLFKEEDQEFLRATMTSLQMGGNSQKKFIEEIADLAGREETSAMKLLQKGEFEEILNHPSLSHAQKGDRLVKYLLKRNYPRLTDARKNFSGELKKLNLPQSASVSSSPSFESEQVTLTVRFQSLSHLKKNWPQLKDLIVRKKDKC